MLCCFVEGFDCFCGDSMVLGRKLGLRIDTHPEVMIDRKIQVQVKVDFKLKIVATQAAVVVLVGGSDSLTLI